MKERINKLAKGIVESDMPRISMSNTSFVGSVSSGEISKFELLLRSENGFLFKGLCYSSHHRVRARKNVFGGVRTKIVCEVDARDCREHELIEGELSLVTNAGEWRIPFRFTVQAHASVEIIGKLDSPGDFRELFEMEGDYAVRIFDYDDFKQAGFMQDQKTRAYYEAFRGCHDRRLSVIEFLKAIGQGGKLPFAVGPAMPVSNARAVPGGVSLVPGASGGSGMIPGFLQDTGSISVMTSETEDGWDSEEPDSTSPWEPEGSGQEKKAGKKGKKRGWDHGKEKGRGQDAENPEKRDGNGLRPAPRISEKEMGIPEKVEAAASMCIRENDLSPEAFRIYGKAIENGSKITWLYEYYLQALPKDFNEAMPREVYLYFGYENEIDENIKLPLYYNIIRCVERDSDIYLRFERQIQEYAIDMLLKSQINERLAAIYERMIYPDMVDWRIAEVLPGILHSYHFVVYDERISSVIVRYVMLEKEESFPVSEGSAYVPLFLPDYVVLFEDSEGNRYSGIRHEKKRLLSKPELEARCYEVNPEQPMMALEMVNRNVKKGLESREELLFVENAMDSIEVSSQYRDRLISAILKYYDGRPLKKSEAGEKEARFLLEIQPGKLEPEDRGRLLNIMVGLGEYEYAYALCRRYSSEGLTREALKELTLSMVGKPEAEDPESLVRLSFRLFREGCRDRQLLCYLLNHYNGLSEEMLRLLMQSDEAEESRKATEGRRKASEEANRKRAVRQAPPAFTVLSLEKKNTEEDAQDPESLTEEEATGGTAEADAPSFRRCALNMAERLLAQMLFSRCREGRERVYTLYRGYGGSEPLLLRAYMTELAADHFLFQRDPGADFFKDLFNLVHGENIKDRVPAIYLLSLTKHMAEAKELMPEEKPELQEMLKVLLGQRLVFGYTKELAKWVPLPDYITDKTYIEYRGGRDECPSIFVKVLPDDQDFHEEEIERVYQNIYVCQLTLFSGESAEYRIFNMESGKEPTASGTVFCDVDLRVQKGDTYDILNKLSSLSLRTDDAALRDAMLRYVKNEALVDELFKVTDA